MKKQRSCIRMDNLDKDQRKQLNSIIEKTVQDFNDKIEAESQQNPEDSEKES